MGGRKDEKMRFEHDTRTVTLEELEKLLCQMLGLGELHDRGCYVNGVWMSPESIMEYIKERV